MSLVGTVLLGVQGLLGVAELAAGGTELAAVVVVPVDDSGGVDARFLRGSSG